MAQISAQAIQHAPEAALPHAKGALHATAHANKFAVKSGLGSGEAHMAEEGNNEPREQCIPAISHDVRQDELAANHAGGGRQKAVHFSFARPHRENAPRFAGSLFLHK